MPAAHTQLTKASAHGLARASEHLPALTRAYERALRAAGRRAAASFMAQARPLLAAVDPTWVPPPDGSLIDQAELEADAVAKTARLHRLMLVEAGEAALEPFGLAFDVAAPTSQQLLDQVSARIKDTITSAIQEQVANAVQAGYRDGRSVAQVSKSIRAATDAISKPRADMLARSDLNAIANAGSLAAASTAGAAPFKQWTATMDDRTRETHADADGQVVPIDQPFDVGGEQAQYPGDPNLSWEEAANCRCTITYVDSLQASAAVTAGSPDTTGLAMVAVYPDPLEAAALAQDDGQDAETLHVTLVFLGDADSFDTDAALAALRDAADATAPLEGAVGGIGRFANGPDGAPLIALPDVQGLSALRERVASALLARGIASPSEHGWLPHLTLDYLDGDTQREEPDCLGLPLTFRTISLAIADERTDFALTGDPVTSGGTMTDTTTPAASPAAELIPVGALNAETLASIKAQLAALDADIYDADELRSMALAMNALATVGREAVTASLENFTLTSDAGGGTRWAATLCIADTPTVDSGIKRILVKDGGSWRPLPIPLALLMDSPHADLTSSSPMCGRIDTIAWAGNVLQADGVFFDQASDPEVRASGAKAKSLVEEMGRLGVSVDLVDCDVDMMVWNGASLDPLYDPNTEADEAELAEPGANVEDGIDITATPDAVVVEVLDDETEYIMAFRRWMVGGATICPVQALTDATISLVASAMSGVGEWRTETTFELEPALGLTAAAAGLVPLHPPREWFDDPKLDGPTPLTVTDDGRVFGHLATWDTCHTGLPGCVPPPRSPTGYMNFHLGEIKTADGGRVAVGTLSFNKGHAGRMASAERAIAHYDDTQSAGAHVRAGEDAYGIWLAGALNPAISAEEARTLMAAPPSGDWRQVRQGEGRDLVGALAVNVPGFPVPRERRGLALAASAGCEPCEDAFGRELQVLAASADGLEGLAALVES